MPEVVVRLPVGVEGIFDHLHYEDGHLHQHQDQGHPGHHSQISKIKNKVWI